MPGWDHDLLVQEFARQLAAAADRACPRCLGEFLFDLGHGWGQRAADGLGMANIVFRCPKSGQFVQNWVDEESTFGKDSYLPVNCPACGKTHFVNRNTSKLLGHEDE